MSEQSLVRYDAMCSAIAAAHAVDEVKDIRDKAMAMQAYARQARNTEAEQWACEIRLRAERRAGQMLAETERAQGARADIPTSVQGDTKSFKASREKAGISHTQATRWQKLAAIPEADFEETFAKPGKKSTAGLIAAHAKHDAPVQEAAPATPSTPKTPVDARALWLWGRLLDFEREGILAADPNELFGTMLDHMKEATRELAPVVAAWLARINP